MDVWQQFINYLRACYTPEFVHTAVLQPGLAAALRSDARDVAATVVVAPAEAHVTLVRTIPRPSFVGTSPGDERVAVLEHGMPPIPTAAPRAFRVCAIVPTYNEADVIEQTVAYLANDGIDVHVIDNWSNDGTYETVQRLQAQGLATVERFPPDGPSGVYDLRGILGRVEQVASQLDSDWVILHDADERRRAPWPGIGLRDALYHVDKAGFTCVDHVTLTFWPIDNGFDPRFDLESYFLYFEFSDHAGHFHQRRAWKNARGGVSLVPSAGHDVRFAGRRVYPYKFLLKHYPIRSQAHGERKVLQERRARFSQQERMLGWHRQYDDVQTFVRNPADLHRFDMRTFYDRWLIERLSGVGVFGRPPQWATPPVWSLPTSA
jgi:glycosyltransferase involved in cell wall biosynthesis